MVTDTGAPETAKTAGAVNRSSGPVNVISSTSEPDSLPTSTFATRMAVSINDFSRTGFHTSRREIVHWSSLRDAMSARSSCWIVLNRGE